MFDDPLIWILILPGMLLGGIEQSRVKAAVAKYSRVPLGHGLTGAQVARYVLDARGLQNVRVEAVKGVLSDHYDPRGKVLRLSEAVYDVPSIAAAGIAAHAAGPAIQDADDYAPMEFRSAIVPVVKAGSTAAPLVFFDGRVVKLPTDQTINGEECVLRVGDGLADSRLADQTLAVEPVGGVAYTTLFNATCRASGGQAPYLYQYEARVGGTRELISGFAPSGDLQHFVLPPGPVLVACLVRDAVGGESIGAEFGPISVTSPFAPTPRPSSSSTSQHNAKLIDKSPPPQPPPYVKTSPPLDRTDEIAMQRARERRQAANAKYNSSVGVCIVGPLELFDFTAPWITGKPT